MSIVQAQKTSQDYTLPKFEKMKADDIYNVIVTVVAPIFLAIAIGLTCQYALVPLAPMIPLTATFSISLPLLVTSGVGVVMTLLLIIQCVRPQKTVRSFDRLFGQVVHSSPCLSRAIRRIVHFGKRSSNVSAEQYTQGLFPFAKQKLVHFNTRDEIKLGGFWFFHDANAPTVIYFHGNGATAERTFDWADYYHNHLNCNVLCVEYRGYGVSEGTAGTASQEMDAYLDGEAALQFVLNQGISKERVTAHGTSLGGAYAASMLYSYGVPKAILDHTFTSLPAVMNATTKVVTRGSAARAIGGIYNSAKYPQHPNIKGAKKLKTDQFNTLKKVSRSKGDVFVIQGAKDLLMPTCFGEDLTQARYGKLKKKNYVQISGGHNCSFWEFGRNVDEVNKLENFVRA